MKRGNCSYLQLCVTYTEKAKQNISHLKSYLQAQGEHTTKILKIQEYKVF